MSDSVQRLHAVKVASMLKAKSIWKKSQHVSFYLPFDGELSTNIVADNAIKEKKHLYLPVADEDKSKPLKFAPWSSSAKIKPNKYGIYEPVCQPEQYVCTSTLDLVLMPLVGFDSHGNRLGMGGGFYDRTFIGRHQWGKKPLLIGLAHANQYVAEGLPCDTWDIILDGVITEESVFFF